jgi:CRP-like cAMP-binding protein
MPSKTARRTGGGQHARTGMKAAQQKQKKQQRATPASRPSRARSSVATAAAIGGQDEGAIPQVEVDPEREWEDPIWAVREPGDVNDTPRTTPDGLEDSFEARVDRVEKTCRESWPVESVRDQPPDRRACERQLAETGGHAGRAISALIPQVSRSGVTVEGTRDGDQPVLPEFMVQKINDLGTQLEAKQKESEEIQRKFRMIDKNHNDEVDVNEFAVLVRQLNIELSDEERVAEFGKIDINGDGRIDVWEFEKWMKGLVRQDSKYADGLNNIGHKAGWAKLKIPPVKDKDRQRSGEKLNRTQKFLNQRKLVKPNHRYWLEVIGSRLSIYDSDDKVVELARLQLSDMEVERVDEEMRVAEGWGDDGARSDNKATAAAGDLIHSATSLLHSVPGTGTKRKVIALGLRLGGGEPYRVAIDLHEVGEADAGHLKAWVETLRSGVSFQGRHRSAKQLWDSLAKRLKLVVQLQKQYGEIHDMYGASTSQFEEVPVPKTIRDPDSLFSGIWDLLQLIMLLLVCYYVPLRTGFSITVELWSYEFWQDAVIDVYFIIDIIIQFRTAYWTRSGVLEVDTTKIRNNYLTGWFLIDFVCVLPLGYIGYFINDSADGDSSSNGIRAVKSLRLLRMGKMMRLAKVYKMLQKYDSIAELKPLIAIFGLVFLVGLASHLLACFWFLIGVNDQIMVPEQGDESTETTVLQGWVNQKANEDEWWGEKGENATLKTRYVTSMYGIFNALENGYTDDEKLFAICAELIVGSVIYGGLAAVLSAAMMESQQASEEFNTNYKKLKTWMTSRKLKSNYQNMVLKAYSHKFKDSTTFDEEKLLADLPPAMASALMDKLYGQYIADVPYFRGLDQVIVIRLASLTKPLTAAKESLIMEEGKVGHEMFILIEGEVMVEMQGIELGYFRKAGSFFGENPVIDPRGSERRTRSVKAVTDCFLVYLEQQTIIDVANDYPELKARLIRFRRLGQRKKRDHEAAKRALESPTAAALIKPTSLSGPDDGDPGADDDEPPVGGAVHVGEPRMSLQSRGSGSETAGQIEELQGRVEKLEGECSPLWQPI